MQLLLIGASGQNGKLIIEEALQRNHSVTALVRNPDSLTPRPRLTIVKGSPLDLDDIAVAIAASPTPPTAVLVSLSLRRLSGSPFAAVSPDSPPTLMADSIRNCLVAMRAANPPIRKLVINSMHGTGSSFGSMTFPMRWLFTCSNMKHTRAGHDAVDQLVREECGEKSGEGIRWVMARPPLLVEGPKMEVKVFAEDGSGVALVPKITRSSVAAFMVDAAERDDWDRSSPVITN